ncbi:bacteriohemerythrin [Clostridiaceae bacterium 68-1-5]|uniref:Bacteriohemerythrin n=1 Tax=Suipraeoptans intestinalis TaxID=2606628 RepID=A0A6N7V1C3_9FIRM|nr:hemerythrin family protein [Suipraeoptans intestinalis]MSR94369.1 bacteriohemerythrin [Suipraeoptans intestinalis]
MYAEFSENLVTGNEMIDTQHEELIGRMNKLLESCELGNEKAVAVRTLDYLADYTDFHFSAEEQLQKEIDYPGIEKHLAQHAIFKETIKDLDQMLAEEEGPSNAFVEKVKENVIQWFYTHIEGFDRSVAEYKFMRENNERL